MTTKWLYYSKDEDVYLTQAELDIYLSANPGYTAYEVWADETFETDPTLKSGTSQIFLRDANGDSFFLTATGGALEFSSPTATGYMIQPIHVQSDGVTLSSGLRTLNFLTSSGFDLVETEDDIFSINVSTSFVEDILDAELTSLSGELQSQITDNSNSLNTLSGLIDDNSSSIISSSGYFDGEISSLSSQITTTSSNLQSDIDQNSSDISTNTSDISTNTADILSVSGELSNYVSLQDSETVSGVKTFAEQVNFLGNVNFSGTTTNINTQDLIVEDVFITVAANQVGTPSLDAGIEVERGIESNAFISWNETADRWYAGLSGFQEEIMRSSNFTSLSGNLQTQIDAKINQSISVTGGQVALYSDTTGLNLQSSTLSYNNGVLSVASGIQINGASLNSLSQRVLTSGTDLHTSYNAVPLSSSSAISLGTGISVASNTFTLASIGTYRVAWNVTVENRNAGGAPRKSLLTYLRQNGVRRDETLSSDYTRDTKNANIASCGSNFVISTSGTNETISIQTAKQGSNQGSLNVVGGYVRVERIF